VHHDVEVHQPLVLTRLLCWLAWLTWFVAHDLSIGMDVISDLALLMWQVLFDMVVDVAQVINGHLVDIASTLVIF